MAVIKYSFHIAVENYQDSAINAVDYAEADAKGLAEALQLHGFEKGKQQVLLSSQATKAATESKLRAAIKRLTEEDIFFLSYAGHGFSKLDQNFLTCYDTQRSDPVATSISLQMLYKELRASRCKRAALFLDSCESGILDMPSRSIFSHMTSTELEEFFSNAEFCVCFASSETLQFSYSASLLKHGIWTYHVIEALEGNAPGALENGRYLTAVSLQDYLTKAVPKSIAACLSTPVHQTPRFYGTQTTGSFLIADLQDVLDKKAALAIPGYQQVKRLTLTGSIEYSVKKLSGFKKIHRVPESVNETTENFVARIGISEVENEINEIFQSLRDEMGYSRQDLSSNTESGAGSIITPDFDYHVSLGLDPDDPKTAILARELSNIKTPTLIDSPGFEAVFARKFSNLEVTLQRETKIEDFIDKVESLKKKDLLKDISIDYPRDCSYCTLRLAGVEPAMTLWPHSFQISQHFVRPPAELFKMLLHVQQRLLSAPELRTLPF